jgi:salicylate hydroxylase
MDKAIAAIGAEKAQNRFMFLGVGGHVLVFPVAEGRIMNVVAFSTTKNGTWEGDWVKPMKREDMAADFEGFGEEWQNIFSVCKVFPKVLRFRLLTFHIADGKHRSLGHFRPFS